VTLCPHSCRDMNVQNQSHTCCGRPRASTSTCIHIIFLRWHTEQAVDTHEFPRPALNQRAAAGQAQHSQKFRNSHYQDHPRWNCAAYKALCTVASVAYIAIRLMHHVSHTRESPCSSLPPHFVALNPFQASNNSRYVMPSAGASTRLTKLSVRLSILYNNVANACNFAQNHR
jgi:hypothetical protein